MCEEHEEYGGCGCWVSQKHALKCTQQWSNQLLMGRIQDELGEVFARVRINILGENLSVLPRNLSL